MSGVIDVIHAVIIRKLMADPEFARLFRYAENQSNFDIDVGATDTKPSLITTTTSYKNYTTILLLLQLLLLLLLQLPLIIIVVLILLIKIMLLV